MNAEDVGMILAVGIASSAAPTLLSPITITVVSATPATNLSYPFLLTIASQTETENSSVEVFRMISGNISGNTFQCSDRALNGTVAQTWIAGDFAELRNNALIPLQLQQAILAAQSAIDAADVYGFLELSGRP